MRNPDLESKLDSCLRRNDGHGLARETAVGYSKGCRLQRSYLQGSADFSQRKVINIDTSKKLLFLSVLFCLLAVPVRGQFYPVGDLNGDYYVDVQDLAVLAQLWVDPTCLDGGCEADLNGTDGVDTADFALLAENWGATGATLLISEFMASNASTIPLGQGDLLDEDGESSDWIEIYNPTNAAVDLDGWHLTDDAGDLGKWQFPHGTSLGPGEFLLVFASEKDRAIAGSELHTNFRLAADGEYLALVESDGVTIAHEYEPRYPDQLTDISYGLAQYATKFVAPGATTSYRVPTQNDAAKDWTALSFNAATWRTGPTSLGFAHATPGFNVTYYKANTAVGHLDTAESVISDLSYQASVVTERAPVINYLNNGSNGHFGGDAPFPGTTIGDDVEDFVVLATAMVLIPQAGDWTFGVNSDDGFSLELSGYGDTFTSSHPDPRGAGDTLTTFDIPEAGHYNLRLVFYERGGNSELEMFAARGRFSSFASGYFRLVGDTAGGGLQVSSFSDAVSTDLQSQMQNVNSSLWTRTEFEAEEVDFFNTLTLRIQYEDGFVAYLNGHEVARSNFTGAPAWNSAADSDRQDELSAAFVSFDISRHIGTLREGRNVLAVCALNDSKADGEFLILPELIAAGDVSMPQYFLTATPGQYNVSGAVERVADTKFSHDRGFYDAPLELAITT
jgi:hypothetical protein